MTLLNRETVATLLDAAIDALIARDGELLELGVTERALSHQLAVCLAAVVPGNYVVDCEYNRHLEDVKTLDLPHRKVLDGEIRARTVFPDIVVHRRNTDKFNLLVVEMKKPGEDISYDQLKLEAFREKLHYTHAAHLVLGLDDNGKLVREVIWVDA